MPGRVAGPCGFAVSVDSDAWRVPKTARPGCGRRGTEEHGREGSIEWYSDKITVRTGTATPSTGRQAISFGRTATGCRGGPRGHRRRACTCSPHRPDSPGDTGLAPVRSVINRAAAVVLTVVPALKMASAKHDGQLLKFIPCMGFAVFALAMPAALGSLGLVPGARACESGAELRTITHVPHPKGLDAPPAR